MRATEPRRRETRAIFEACGRNTGNPAVCWPSTVILRDGQKVTRLSQYTCSPMVARFATFALLALTRIAAGQQTALDRYVAQKDSVYGWKLVRTVPGAGYKTHVLELTSQSWRTAKDVDRPVWK